jgi:hypothetical protein
MFRRKLLVTDKVVPFGRVGAPASTEETEFANRLGQAAAQALKMGATSAVLVYYDGATVRQIPVDAPHPLARGMMEEAAEWYGSRCAGVE